MALQRKIAVIGLGTVGLAVAIAFGRKYEIIAYDNDPSRIEQLRSGQDTNKCFSPDDLLNCQLTLTTEASELAKADFYIVSVPTAVDSAHVPILLPLINVSKTIGTYLKAGDIVVYESSVYPGATEEVCIPVLEECSHLKAGKDFSVGYSPERVDPGNTSHTIENTTKIIAALDSPTLDVIHKIYSVVMECKLYPVSCIKVAEAAKIIENTYRDVNIAFVNEIALIMHKIGIDTEEVLNACATKWNFSRHRQGLVGGTCIGVNSQYLMYKAEQLGYHPKVVAAAREINNVIEKYIADETIRNLIKLKINPVTAKIAIFGFTYKENYSSAIETHIIYIIKELKNFGVDVIVHDHLTDPSVTKKIYDVDLTPWEDINEVDAMIFAVPHDFYKNLSFNEILSKFSKNNKLIIDIKNIIDKTACAKNGVHLWRF